MILISNHLLRLHSIYVKESNVIRINIAWVKDEEELREYLDIPHSVFVDYPDGRTKPPVALMTVDETIDIISKYDNVKFFAISNAEDFNRVRSVKNKLPDGIMLVPKIETKAGVENIDRVMEASSSNYIMLDKEDLYVNVKQDRDEYIQLMARLRDRCKEINVNIFELSGVIFDDNN